MPLGLAFVAPAPRVRVCMCAIRLWLGSKPLAHYISRNFQLGTCAQALETFFWFFSLLPVSMGVGVSRFTTSWLRLSAGSRIGSSMGANGGRCWRFSVCLV